MKSRVALLLIFLTLLSCARQNVELRQQEVESLMQQWLKLWNSYDTNQLDDIFWNSPDLTYFSSEKKGLIKGFDQLKPHHEGFGFVAGGKTPANALWLEDVSITLHQNTAVVDAIWFFGDEQMPRDSVQQGPCTFVIVRDEEEEVKIAHVHFGNY